MTPEKLDKLQNLAIVLAIGLVIPPAIGFGLGLWVTKGSAERTTTSAVLAVQTDICVAQFTSAPNYTERLKAYKALDYSAKSAYFEKGGWSRMPGAEKTQSGVTEGCASKLEALT